MTSRIVTVVRCLSLAVTLALSATLASRAAEQPAPTWKIEKREVRIDIQQDGSTTSHYDIAYTVLAESAIEDLAEQRISYHERSGKLSEVVAYTRKADGKHIDLPATNTQEGKGDAFFFLGAAPENKCVPLIHKRPPDSMWSTRAGN